MHLHIYITRIKIYCNLNFKQSEIKGGDLIDPTEVMLWRNLSRYICDVTFDNSGKDKIEMHIYVCADKASRSNGLYEKNYYLLLLVEPEGPWSLQGNARALLSLDRADGLIGQDRCLQQVRRKRSTLLRFALRRGHVWNDDAAAL